jgi:hypothetical protein
VYLTSTSLANWLIRRGLLDPAAVISGQFAVQEIERHNRGFRVYRPVDRPLYVKQLREFDRPNIQCLQREAAFGAAVSRCDAVEWLSSRVPEFLDYDFRHHVVTVRLLPDTLNLHEYVERSTVIPDSVASGLGHLIASFHSAECDNLLSSIDVEHQPGDVPWILSFHHDQGAGSLSPGNQQLLFNVQSDSTLTGHLDEVRESWRATSLMHGDLKWTNVLLETEPDAAWHVIDWEMADRGDPLWDLATMIQCWWSYWILSTPPQSLTPLDDFRERRHEAFVETRSSLDAMWSAYSGTAGIAGQTATSTLEHVVRLAAARLIQTVYELHNSGGADNAYVELMLETARRLLACPDSMSELVPGADS